MDVLKERILRGYEAKETDAVGWLALLVAGD